MGREGFEPSTLGLRVVARVSGVFLLGGQEPHENADFGL